MMVQLLTTEQLDDQLAALAWLQAQPVIARQRIAVAGNSFGGIEAVLGAARGGYCAAVAAAAGAESWAESAELQTALTSAARAADTPMLFFQADNDYDLAPSKTMAAQREQAGKRSQVRIYPAYGHGAAAGHSFAYRGSAIWFSDVYRFISDNCGP